ncbi:thioredoxin family protein [Parapedobacter sp. ISTM3]|uniref:Thiol-disulfide isomerase or thioredoxin n=1 Tax=Parapedobacter luteus TaxID=623280 RepID=A0A1T4ZUG2_9SPHI|nr:MULTISPECIES: thioredoxin family protein [Parapedobacter]MBK1438632.1 thioredoxin family protein [Parapedobacter sp. ISTM3]SKB26149.1 Thiol-disulfide isomerase or thioredoxin [Parapedobacter luteus]
MRQLFYTLLAVIASALPAVAQPASTPIVNTEYTRANGQKVLLGHCSPSMMQGGIYREWYDRSYDGYTIDSGLAKQFAPLLDGKVIEVFAGSWCGDTRREIPRLMKLLNSSNFDTTQLKLIFVDNSRDLYKQSPQHEEAGKAIHRIPTIIVYEDGKELNRIVETPVNSLEQDLLDILSGKPYVSNYYAITYWQQQDDVNEKLSAERLAELATAIKHVSKNAGELNSYSYALAAQGQLTEAANVLELNTLLYPADPVSYLSLSKLYRQAGEVKLAQKNLQKVLALQPDNSEAAELLEQL